MNALHKEPTMSGTEPCVSDAPYLMPPRPETMSCRALREYLCVPWHRCRGCDPGCCYGAEYLRRVDAGEMDDQGGRARRAE